MPELCALAALGRGILIYLYTIWRFKSIRLSPSFGSRLGLHMPTSADLRGHGTPGFGNIAQE